MTGSRYPVKRDTTDLLTHPDQGLTEQERQQEIADKQDLGASGGGGFTPHAVKVQRVSAQTFLDNTEDFVVYDNAIYESTAGEMWSAGTPDRVTIPVTGLYSIVATHVWDSIDHSKDIESALIANTSDRISIQQDGDGKVVTDALWVTLPGEAVLQAGDILRVALFQNSGASKSTRHVSLAGPNHVNIGPTLAVALVG